MLGSPLFIRTTANEAAPIPAPATYEVFPTATLGVTATATLVITTTVARGELQYVDALPNGKGVVMLIRLGGRDTLRFEDVAITNAPDVHVYLSRESGGMDRDDEPLPRPLEGHERLLQLRHPGLVPTSRRTGAS